MSFTECTKLYKAASKLAKPLERSHMVISVRTGPELHGHPTRRTRSLSVCLSRKTMIWVGPPTHQVQDHFDSIFARSTALTGSVYFLASDEKVREHAKHAQRKRGLSLDDDEMNELQGMDLLDTFLPMGAHQRLEAYNLLRDKLQAFDGTYIVDLEQWPNSRAGAAGPYFPSQLTHGSIINVDTMKYAVGSDHLSANGFHMYETTSDNSTSKMAPILARLSGCEQKSLSGNGQSLPAIAAWFLYVFCHSVRKPKVSLIKMPATEESWSGDEESFTDEIAPPGPMVLFGEDADEPDEVEKHEFFEPDEPEEIEKHESDEPDEVEKHESVEKPDEADESDEVEKQESAEAGESD